MFLERFSAGANRYLNNGSPNVFGGRLYRLPVGKKDDRQNKKALVIN